MKINRLSVIIMCAAIFGFMSIFLLRTRNADAETAEPYRHPQMEKFVRAYPGQITGYTKDEIRFADGTSMKISDNITGKDWTAILNTPDLDDMMSIDYPEGDVQGPFKKNFDPGRIRYEPFFKKMYGGTKKEIEKNLVPIKWLPALTKKTLSVTKINDVAGRLEKISGELQALPPRFHKYVLDPGGTYAYRVIKDTGRMSLHSFGIAIDITVKFSHYWNWDYDDELDDITYKNSIPYEIVRIFEKYGFIWGGKWYHYDTMHFEYRPEMFVKLQ